MTKDNSVKIRMFDHSLAKVELLSRYLSIYLNILARVSAIEKIHIYDLFAGEGKYSDKKFGSSIEILQCIKKHYFANGKTIKPIKVLLNDSEYSQIEPHRKKIDRIREFAQGVYKPPNVEVSFNDLEFSTILPVVLDELKILTWNERALLFIDPYGYKEIKPSQLYKLFSYELVEIILFLPISFMYRFCNKSITEDFPPGKPLENFIRELYNDQYPDLTSIPAFITDLREKFKRLLKTNYVATFYIERDKTNIYCLFFFTHNKKGYQKMIDAKWSIDQQDGQGYKLFENLSLFTKSELQSYPQMLLEFISSSNGKTNAEIVDYGYELEFKPSASTEVLQKLRNENNIEILSLDGKAVRGFYLSDLKRKILIRKKT